MNEEKSYRITDVTKKDIKDILIDDKLFAKFFRTNVKYVHNIAGKYASVGTDEYNDYFQIASLSLHKALRKYDPDRNIKLSTFAYTVMLNDVKQQIKKNIKIANKEVSIESFARKFDNDSSSDYSENVFEHLYMMEDFENNLVDKIEAYRFYNSLEEIHQKIFTFRVVEKMKHRDIAKQLNLNFHTYKHIWHYHVRPKMIKFQREYHI